MCMTAMFAALCLLSGNVAAQRQPGPETLGYFLGVAPERLHIEEKDSPNLIFQTNVAYDPRVDLRADRVIIHRHGADMESVVEALQSWQAAGHDVIRMFFVSSDAGQHFEQGRVTGEPRPDVMEMTAGGRILRIEGHRAYIFPDDDWIAYVRGFIDHAFEHGAVGVAPEEPFGHAQTGYEEAYKRIWEETMDVPWTRPHASPASFWQSAQFKSDRFYDMMDQLSAHSKAIAGEQEKSFDCLLPVHSLLSNMAGGRIFPNVRSIDLEHVDAWIAQVWQGPVLWALGNLAGTRYDGFFESALGLYGTFAELSRNTDKTMYFLVDPVEDDPRRSWTIYQDNYERCVVAMLQFPWVDHYEVMPWPDRIFLPGYAMGSGTPGPSDYLTRLMAVQTVLNDMPHAEAVRSRNDQGLGVLIADTASWEIHGPESPGFDAFHGLYLPFAVQGILVRLPWLERAAEPGYLDDFRVLALSYDLQKPERPEIHDGLLDWVRNGGRLVLVGGDSAYNAVDAWWNRDGFASPAEALLRAAGVETTLTPGQPLSRISFADRSMDIAEQVKTIVFSDIPDAKVLARNDTGDVIAFAHPLGRGGLVALGTPAGWGAQSETGVAVFAQAIQYAAGKAGAALEPMNTVSIRRGPWLAAYVMKTPETFTGTFIDVFDDAYPVVENPAYPAGSSVLLKEVFPEAMRPQLLFATHRLVFAEARKNEFALVMEGPSETLAAARIASPYGKDRISGIHAVTAEGHYTPVIHKYDPDSRSSLIQFTYHPQGVAVRMHWE